MSKSIFDIEVRLDINKEFNKMVRYLHLECNTSKYKENITLTSFIKAVNNYSFKNWPYRGTAIDCEEYLDNIGLDEQYFYGGSLIEKEKFLYYLEFIYNISMFSIGDLRIYDKKVVAVLSNIGLIAEKMNYTFKHVDDKFLLIKRDAEVDNVLDLVDNDITNKILEYNDFKNENDIDRKKEILKALDRFIEGNQSAYSKLDNDTYRSIGYIMNNFGINHKINDKYKSLSDVELLEWYDKCFRLCLYLISLPKVKEINDERKKLEA